MLFGLLALRRRLMGDPVGMREDGRGKSRIARADIAVVVRFSRYGDGSHINNLGREEDTVRQNSM